MATIVVSGALANKPLNGGNAWAILNWLLGLRRLGCQVFFIEQIDRASCVDDCGCVVPFEESANLAFFKQVTERFELASVATFLYEDGERSHGQTRAELLDLACAADGLLNISGHLTLAPLMRRLRRKVFIDFDPGYTQFWHAAGLPGAHLAGHDDFYTIGENIGTPASAIPTDGIRWRHTRQPIVLEHCPVAAGGDLRFTTVASWRGAYGPVEYNGQIHGLKVHEFRKFFDLPERAQLPFEIALLIHPADAQDLAALREHGWQLVDPRGVAGHPDAFDSYVRSSGAEFSVAQGIYVKTQSGWFSDRTVRYLAAGRPALVQNTGFDRTYPVGEGLVAFNTLDEAVTGAQRIARDYEAHCRVARALAEEYFDSDGVLGQLLDELNLAP